MTQRAIAFLLGLWMTSTLKDRILAAHIAGFDAVDRELYAKLETAILNAASSGETRLILSIKANGREQHWYPTLKVLDAMRLQGLEMRKSGYNDMIIEWLPYNKDLAPWTYENIVTAGKLYK